jgi:hypothetical protein
MGCSHCNGVASQTHQVPTLFQLQPPPSLFLTNRLLVTIFETAETTGVRGKGGKLHKNEPHNLYKISGSNGSEDIDGLH